MRLGIVGHAQEKFTPETELLARAVIRVAIKSHGATTIISGRSPMGGVDIYAEQIAAELGLPTDIKEPRQNSWHGEYGFKARNLDIAKQSDKVLVVVVRTLPPGFKGMSFDGCYHCGSRNPEHVKSGGCWTAWRARSREWVIL